MDINGIAACNLNTMFTLVAWNLCRSLLAIKGLGRIVTDIRPCTWRHSVEMLIFFGCYILLGQIPMQETTKTRHHCIWLSRIDVFLPMLFAFWLRKWTLTWAPKTMMAKHSFILPEGPKPCASFWKRVHILKIKTIVW